MKTWQYIVMGLMIAAILAVVTMPFLDKMELMKSDKEKKLEQFRDPGSDLFFNRKALTDSDADSLLKSYEAVGYHAEWDEDGYLTLAKRESTAKLILISYAKKWVTPMYEFELIPETGTYRFRYSYTEQIGNEIRTYHYLEWTEESAKAYAESTIGKGFANDIEVNPSFSPDDYTYVAYNNDGNMVKVVYDSSVGNTNGSCIAISYFITEVE